MQKMEKGVTLIALVVTIVILLILASISIKSIKGERGTIRETEEAASNAERESIIQKIQADLYNEKAKSGKSLSKIDLKNIIQQNDYSSSMEDNKFISKTGGYEIQYKEITGWENIYIKNRLILHLDAINNTGSGDNNHSQTATIWKNLENGKNNAIIDGAVWDNNSLSFDGVDDWAKLGQFIDQKTITIEATIMPKNTSVSEEDVFGNWEEGGFGIYLANGVPYFDVHVGGEYIELTSGEQLNQNQIYTICGTYDGNSAKIYINGELKDTKNISGIIANPESDTTMIIGAKPLNDHPVSDFANINMYSGRIYDRALTEEEVKNNYEIDKERFNF